jgi:AcrR family transcriptional regulator
MLRKRVRDAQAERTRKTLCRHARRLFAKKGYADATIGEIVRKAGVTKGALYHHFDDKLQLYRAVVEDMERELVARINTSTAGDDPWQRLTTTCSTYLDACLDHDVQRILILEAPVVLGWKAWCDIDIAYGIGTLASCLDDAMSAGVIQSQPTVSLAQVLLGALNNGGRVIAAAADPEDARVMIGESIERLIAGLRKG